MKCFALLLQTPDSHEKCDKYDVVRILYQLLAEIDNVDEDENMEMVVEYALMALHNCLITTFSRWRAREFWELPMCVIRHAHCKHNERIQMHALQVNITNIQIYQIEGEMYLNLILGSSSHYRDAIGQRVCS